jgi:TPR repeat protein
MKKLPLFLTVFLCTGLFANNLYFQAYKDIRQAKRIMNKNPQQSQRLFIEAYSYLKQLVNASIDSNKPSANSFTLLGNMYLNGWGVDKNEQEGIKLLCGAKLLGSRKAERELKKMGVKCQKINFKELKQ